MNTLKEQNIFDAAVGQDKYAPERVYKASGQPVTPETSARTNHDSHNAPDKHHGSNKRQTEQIAGWVLPHIKSEVRRIEKLKGWS